MPKGTPKQQANKKRKRSETKGYRGVMFIK